MTAEDNKIIMQGIMDELSRGNGKPFVEAMDDDFSWTLPGRNAWSGTYSGKREVRERLLTPLFAQFATKYCNTARRILVDGDFVVVECQGAVTTKTGKAYDNSYCYVIRFEGGKMKHLNEYMDTSLVEEALEAPDRASAA
ncbi:nuclear transport factor 2 family protein [Kordiimonas sp.]